MLAGFFIAVVLASAVLVSLALSRAQDPVVRSFGRFAPAVGVCVFLSFRVLGLAASAWIIFAVGMAAAVFVVAALFERNAEGPTALATRVLRPARTARARLLGRRPRAGS